MPKHLLSATAKSAQATNQLQRRVKSNERTDIAQGLEEPNLANLQMKAEDSSAVRQLKALQRNADASATIQGARNHLISKSTPHPVIQPRWIATKGGFVWNQAITGVRWHANSEGLMWYDVVNEDDIKFADRETVLAEAGRREPRTYWLAHSAAGFDILSNLDATVEKQDSGKDVVSTAKLKKFKSSQFKEIFHLPDGRLLAVFKSGSDADALSEVTMLHRIAEHGFTTASPEIIQVDFGGKRTLGIAMDEVKGVFVDTKVDNTDLVGYLLQQAALGNSPPTSEFGLVNTMRAMMAAEEGKGATPDKAVIAKLLSDLKQILESKEEFIINDLQFIVQPNGAIVIIDPQSAGVPALFGESELGFAKDLYRKLGEARDWLEEHGGGK
ncbi:hypothetical protein [Roseovarius aestuarii]|uniref:Uncharacterized protein n=1 Tax=Roseovarius aestuarii TaxID=475083 RepID=A0A1X7BXZ3_9RHOB|nr:hypothetical protein [Roseovarius aestuarii]SMC14481.1 hypothetical protein ROA7745_04348 [Roseovarius aestuarii]